MVAEKDELPLVMQEIAEAMQASAVALTIHPEEGGPEVIYADGAAGVTAALVRQLLSDGTIGDPRQGGHEWKSTDLGPDLKDLFLIPVAKVPGQSRLMIAVFFSHLTSKQRQAAQEVYLRRRPFAIGYFRLWQLDRARTRRVEALETALNLMGMGVLLLDRAGDVLFCNDVGHVILEKGEGLRRHRRSIRATNLSDSLRLQVALDHVMDVGTTQTSKRNGTRTAPLVALRRDDELPLILSVLPTDGPAKEPSDAAAIIFALDPAQDVDRLIQPLCDLYNLSAVEATLMRMLAKGTSIASASETLGLKEQTARGYLKQIFVKTGTNRQSELMRRMLSSIVRISGKVAPEIF